MHSIAFVVDLPFSFCDWAALSLSFCFSRSFRCILFFLSLLYIENSCWNRSKNPAHFGILEFVHQTDNAISMSVKRTLLSTTHDKEAEKKGIHDRLLFHLIRASWQECCCLRAWLYRCCSSYCRYFLHVELYFGWWCWYTDVPDSSVASYFYTFDYSFLHLLTIYYHRTCMPRCCALFWFVFIFSSPSFIRFFLLMF